MTASRIIIQTILLLIGIILILATYFLYPKITKEKIEKSVVEDSIITIDEDESNVFENIEYTGIYNINNTFTVKSEKADIMKEEPDIVYMTNMHVTLDLNDGRTVVITSDQGKYNKVTYDCYFQKNVRATDNETLMLSENLDLISSQDTVTVYNDVVVTGEKGSIRADKITYDFLTRNYHVSMFNDRKVKIKLIND